MRFKYRLQSALQFFAFAFYPPITLVACFGFSAAVFCLLAFAMDRLQSGSTLYNIVFALATGAAGSFFVSFIVEMCSNYKSNLLAWHELQDYYNAVKNYELTKQVLMHHTPSQRAVIKAHEEFEAQGGMEKIDEDFAPKDSVQAAWEQLPAIMPVLKETFEKGKAYLSMAEVNILKNVLSAYSLIEGNIHMRIMEDFWSSPEADILESILPRDMISKMPTWMQRQMAEKEADKAVDKLADIVCSDKALLLQYFEDFDISEKAINDYAESDEMQADADDRQWEEKHRAFMAQLISECCKDIDIMIDQLEQYILQKPYYSIFLKMHRNVEKEPIDDTASQMAYKQEKQQLDKLLAEQRGKDG